MILEICIGIRYSIYNILITDFQKANQNKG